LVRYWQKPLWFFLKTSPVVLKEILKLTTKTVISRTCAMCPTDFAQELLFHLLSSIVWIWLLNDEWLMEILVSWWCLCSLEPLHWSLKTLFSSLTFKTLIHLKTAKWGLIVIIDTTCMQRCIHYNFLHHFPTDLQLLSKSDKKNSILLPKI